MKAYIAISQRQAQSIVNKLTAARERKRRADQECEMLEAALCDYMNAKGADVVFLSRCRLIYDKEAQSVKIETAEGEATGSAGNEQTERREDHV